MTLSERLASAQADLAALYLQREQGQAQAQQIAQRNQQLQVAMLEKDGEIRAYQTLLAAEKEAAK